MSHLPYFQQRMVAISCDNVAGILKMASSVHRYYRDFDSAAMNTEHTVSWFLIALSRCLKEFDQATHSNIKYGKSHSSFLQ